MQNNINKSVSATDKDILLKMVDIEKTFPGVKALDHAQLTVKKGTVHALMGENGAGKSTFIKVITGVHKAEEGEMYLFGEKVDFKGPKDAQAAGIAAVYQHPTSYPHLSVAENIFMGHEIIKHKMIQWKAMNEEANKLLKQLNADFDATAEMGTLSVAQQQMVEIAKALSTHAKIVILDEPTAGLDPNERIRFRNLISELSQDRLVLLSTHIVSDIEYIANQVLLMKDGNISHSGTQEEIIQSVPVKVWSCVVANNEVEMWQKQFKVSNMKTLSDGIELRILSEKSPHYNAKEETMTLEDIFLYYFGEKTGDDYDVL